jgi:carboxypeptidase Taq
MVPSFRHHDEQNSVGAEARCVVQRLANFGGRRVANDQNVLASTKVHAGIDDRQGALGHAFSVTNFFVTLAVRLSRLKVCQDGFRLSLCEVKNFLNIAVNVQPFPFLRAVPAEGEGHISCRVQPFFNVCFFYEKSVHYISGSAKGSVEEARVPQTAMDLYEEFLKRVQDIHRLGALQGHLGWDQEVLMPAKGAHSRGEMMAWLAGQRHQQLTDSRMDELLTALETLSLDADQAANVREMRRMHDQAACLPQAFVETFAQARSEALVAWQEARAASDFEAFKPSLERLIALTREKIDLLGVTSTPYDVLLDEYEVGMTVADYDPLFAGLKARLVPLLQAITTAQSSVSEPELPPDLRFPVEAQKAFCKAVSTNMGFDFEAGRMDASTHPFSAGLWPGDTRFTTRFDEADPFSCLYAVMHETGHALYEQGLDHDHRFTPRGGAVSLGVHESQSRFWENQIGRTSAFWKAVLPWFKSSFPDAPEWGEDVLNKLANRVERGYIRVEADEVTYNLHVMIRYEIEKQLFNGDLDVGDLPEVWNGMFKEWFDLDVPEDRLGCLQDIHWSMGAFGYFPTYTLGNLYAAQLLEAMRSDLGDLDARVASGEWEPMLAWLRPRIHQRGSQVTPAQLIEEATGSPPSPEPFLRYVEEKYGALYNLG